MTTCAGDCSTCKVEKCPTSQLGKPTFKQMVYTHYTALGKEKADPNGFTMTGGLRIKEEGK